MAESSSEGDSGRGSKSFDESTSEGDNGRGSKDLVEKTTSHDQSMNDNRISILEGKADELETMIFEIKARVKKQGKLLKSLMQKYPPSEASNASIDVDAEDASETNEIVIDDDHIQIFGKKVNRLQPESAKLNSNKGNAALQLLGMLFSDEELVNGNPRGVTNSSDKARKKNICQLDPRRINYIKDHIEHKFGKRHFGPLMKSLIQKCTDMYKNHKELRLK
ncbi:uncharacterized protein [Dysidea avara]|uniref:uncharacterized protein isoform X2 n=1 Tax=Dysidea avara TaxID=196820 RepID=UPI0033244A69